MLDYSDDDDDDAGEPVKGRTLKPFNLDNGNGQGRAEHGSVGSLNGNKGHLFYLRSKMPALTSDALFNRSLPINAEGKLIEGARFSYFHFKGSGTDRLFDKSNSRTIQAHPDSFYKSITTLVVLAQCCAVLPVTGTTGPNYKSLKFSWLNQNTLYWAVSLAGNLFYFVCYLRFSLRTGIYTRAASKLVFYGSAVVSSVLLLQMGRKWKKLNEEFARMEIRFRKFGYPRKIGFRFRVLAIAALIAGLVDYILSRLTLLDEKLCHGHPGDILSILRSFFLREFKEVFQFYEYNLAAGFLMFVSNMRTSTVWVIQDLFLAFISCSIAERFKQINQLLDRVQGQAMPITFWKEIREDYNDLTVLTKRVDAHTQKIMFLAIGTDLFILCMTLFNNLQNKISSMKLLNFFWSFAFQVIRTIFLALSAARINDESKEPKTVLYSVPSGGYTREVRRFLTQLTTNEVALTGCGFFSVTRSLILTVMGTVITYEIVLVQFSTSASGETPDGLANSTCIK